MSLMSYVPSRGVLGFLCSGIAHRWESEKVVEQPDFRECALLGWLRWRESLLQSPELLGFWWKVEKLDGQEEAMSSGRYLHAYTGPCCWTAGDRCGRHCISQSGGSQDVACLIHTSIDEAGENRWMKIEIWSRRKDFDHSRYIVGRVQSREDQYYIKLEQEVIYWPRSRGRKMLDGMSYGRGGSGNNRALHQGVDCCILHCLLIKDRGAIEALHFHSSSLLECHQVHCSEQFHLFTLS